MELQRTQILLEKSQHEMLSQIAQEENRSLPAIVREMIDRELRYRQCRQMLRAARELQADDNTDAALAEFTALDSDDFLFESDQDARR